MPSILSCLTVSSTCLQKPCRGLCAKMVSADGVECPYTPSSNTSYALAWATR